jgi:hypothetical protein
VPLLSVHALHHKAICDRCRHGSEVLCSESLPSARREAAAELRDLGWRHVVAPGDRRPKSWVEQEGAGEWLCPACAVGLVVKHV